MPMEVARTQLCSHTEILFDQLLISTNGGGRRARFHSARPLSVGLPVSVLWLCFYRKVLWFYKSPLTFRSVAQLLHISRRVRFSKNY